MAKPFAVPLADLAALPRRELIADFHCVAGWSATDLRWEGVAYETFHRLVIEPAIPADPSVTHAVFEGLDGYRSIVLLEDALRDDVILADHLNGRPLDSDHGAPVRLVSPSQYGFVSTKHLCRIETPRHGAEAEIPPHSVHPGDAAAGQAAYDGRRSGERSAIGTSRPGSFDRSTDMPSRRCVFSTAAS